MARTGPKLSLLEAALLFGLAAVVLAIFVPTFLRRVRTNKISEASELLEQMSRHMQAYYETSWPSGARHCLPPSAGPTPPKPSVDPASVDFASENTSGYETWSAIGFAPERPVRYSYRYTTSHAGCDLRDTVEVTFSAHGDLDGDGVLSTFERRASIGPDGFEPAEALLVHQRTE